VAGEEGAGSHGAYKMARECVKSRIAWIKQYREVTGVETAETNAKGARLNWKSVQEAIDEFLYG
jgi:hypothetical protein